MGDGARSCDNASATAPGPRRRGRLRFSFRPGGFWGNPVPLLPPYRRSVPDPSGIRFATGEANWAVADTNSEAELRGSYVAPCFKPPARPRNPGRARFQPERCRGSSPDRAREDGPLAWARVDRVRARAQPFSGAQRPRRRRARIAPALTRGQIGARFSRAAGAAEARSDSTISGHSRDRQARDGSARCFGWQASPAIRTAFSVDFCHPAPATGTARVPASLIRRGGDRKKSSGQAP